MWIWIRDIVSHVGTLIQMLPQCINTLKRWTITEQKSHFIDYRGPVAVHNLPIVGSKYDIFAACSLTVHNPALLSICSKHFPRRLNRVPPSSAFSLTVSHRNCNIELSVSNMLIDWNILNMQSNIRDVSVDFLVCVLFPTEGLLTLRQTWHVQQAQYFNHW